MNMVTGSCKQMIKLCNIFSLNKSFDNIQSILSIAISLVHCILLAYLVMHVWVFIK